MSDKEVLAHIGPDEQHSDTGKDRSHDSTFSPLEAIPSQVASEVPAAAEIHDGGVRAWIQVIGCFFLVRALLLLWTEQF